MNILTRFCAVMLLLVSILPGVGCIRGSLPGGSPTGIAGEMPAVSVTPQSVHLSESERLATARIEALAQCIHQALDHHPDMRSNYEPSHFQGVADDQQLTQDG